MFRRSSNAVMALCAIFGCCQSPNHLGETAYKPANLVGADGSNTSIFGRWGLPLNEYLRGTPIAKQLRSRSLYPSGEPFLLVTAFRKDGTCDWSKSEIGASMGWLSFQDKGDWEYGIKDPEIRYRIVKSDHTSRRSYYEIECYQEPPRPQIINPWKTMKLVGEIRKDGLLDYSISTQEIDGEWTEKTLTLRRMPDSDVRDSNEELQSAISGNWGDGKAVWLIISPQGRFNWAGTVEGGIYRWFQLLHDGDRSAFFLGPLIESEILSHEYGPGNSLLRIKVSRVANGTVQTSTVTLEGKAKDANSIMLSVFVQRKGSKLNRKYNLERMDPGKCRVDSLFAAMKINLFEDKKENMEYSGTDEVWTKQ